MTEVRVEHEGGVAIHFAVRAQFEREATGVDAVLRVFHLDEKKFRWRGKRFPFERNGIPEDAWGQ